MRHHVLLGLVSTLLAFAGIAPAYADAILPPDPPGLLPGAATSFGGSMFTLSPITVPPASVGDLFLNIINNDPTTSTPFVLPNAVIVGGVQQPLSFVPGAVILLEGRTGDTSRSNWSDVLLFRLNDFRFWSDPNFAFIPDDILDGRHVFRYEVQAAITGEPGEGPVAITMYDAGNVTYHIRSDPAVVPEPSTLLLLGSSLAGLGGFAWRRQRHK